MHGAGGLRGCGRRGGLGHRVGWGGVWNSPKPNCERFCKKKKKKKGKKDFMHTNSMGKKSFSNPFKPCEGRKGVMEAVWSWGPRASPRKAQMLLGALRPRAPSSPAGAPLQLLTPALPQSLSLRVAARGRPGPPPRSPPPPAAGAPGRGRTGARGQLPTRVQTRRRRRCRCRCRDLGARPLPVARAPPPPAAVRRCEGARGGPRAGGGGLQAAPSPPTRRCRSAAGSGPRRALHPPGGPGSAGGAPREAAVACRAPEGLPRGASPPAAGKAPRPPPPVCSRGPSRPQDAGRWVVGLVPGGAGRGGLSGPRRPGPPPRSPRAGRPAEGCVPREATGQPRGRPESAGGCSQEEPGGAWRAAGGPGGLLRLPRGSTRKPSRDPGEPGPLFCPGARSPEALLASPCWGRGTLTPASTCRGGAHGCSRATPA